MSGQIYFSSKDIIEIIKAASDSNLVKFKCESIELEFASKNVVMGLSDLYAPLNNQTTVKEIPVQGETQKQEIDDFIREYEEANLMAYDPVAYEEKQRNGN